MQPWDPERRARTKAKIDKEAARAAARLGADGVMLIALYRDGEFVHMQDGGRVPMDVLDLYRNLVQATEMLRASGGKDPGFIQ